MPNETNQGHRIRIGLQINEHGQGVKASAAHPYSNSPKVIPFEGFPYPFRNAYMPLGVLCQDISQTWWLKRENHYFRKL